MNKKKEQYFPLVSLFENIKNLIKKVFSGKSYKYKNVAQ